MIVTRRVCEVLNGWVYYDYPDDSTRVIYRTMAQHTEATKQQPTVGQLVKFEMTEDWCDGPSFSYAT